MAARVSVSDFEAKVLGAKIPVLVEFYSDSCVPCKQMAPILGDVEDDYEGRVAVYKVNINFDSEVAQRYNVMSSPTFLIFRNGEKVDSRHGIAPKQEFIEWVQKWVE